MKNSLISFLLIVLLCPHFAYSQNEKIEIGGDVANGGNWVRGLFIGVGKEIVQSLDNESFSRFKKENQLNESVLLSVLTEKNISVSLEPLTDNTNSSANALAEHFHIRLYYDHWKEFFEQAHHNGGKGFYFLVFHEILRSTGYLDHDYEISLGWKDIFERTPTAPIALIDTRCEKESPQEPHLNRSTFFSDWSLSEEEMKESYERVYHSDHRMPYRLYFDREKKKFLAPILLYNSRRLGYRDIEIEISEKILENITRHVQKSIESGFASYVFFSDLGVVFPYLKKSKHEEQASILYKGRGLFTETETWQKLYDFFYNSEELSLLFRASMQFEFLNRVGRDLSGNINGDHKALSRFFARNIIGKNSIEPSLILAQENQSRVNTYWPEDMLKVWGITLNAHKDGCFMIRPNGKTTYFDISLQELPLFEDDYKHRFQVKKPRSF